MVLVVMEVVVLHVLVLVREVVLVVEVLVGLEVFVVDVLVILGVEVAGCCGGNSGSCCDGRCCGTGCFCCG